MKFNRVQQCNTWSNLYTSYVYNAGAHILTFTFMFQCPGDQQGANRQSATHKKLQMICQVDSIDFLPENIAFQLLTRPAARCRYCLCASLHGCLLNCNASIPTVTISRVYNGSAASWVPLAGSISFSPRIYDIAFLRFTPQAVPCSVFMLNTRLLKCFNLCFAPYPMRQSPMMHAGQGAR